MMNYEMLPTSTFEIPCSLFDIISLPPFLIHELDLKILNGYLLTEAVV